MSGDPHRVTGGRQYAAAFLGDGVQLRLVEMALHVPLWLVARICKDQADSMLAS